MKTEFKNQNDIISIDITDTDYKNHNDNLEYLSVKINDKDVFCYDDDIDDIINYNDDFDYDKAVCICQDKDTILDDFSIDEYFEIVNYFEWAIYYFNGEYYMYSENMNGGTLAKLSEMKK